MYIEVPLTSIKTGAAGRRYNGWLNWTTMRESPRFLHTGQLEVGQRLLGLLDGGGRPVSAAVVHRIKQVRHRDTAENADEGDMFPDSHASTAHLRHDPGSDPIRSHVAKPADHEEDVTGLRRRGLPRQRDTVERGFNQPQTLARRGHPYDKFPLTHLGGVTLAAAITAHRMRLADTPNRKIGLRSRPNSCDGDRMSTMKPCLSCYPNARRPVSEP
ncbi:MAG TPA: hypothetical protein VMU34_22015, partial [Mycobacterium sp.]|nr:hypothetical protein [Mycobacterium sp.]